MSYNAKNLYKGEKIQKINGVEHLIRFFPSKKSKPLIVFFPGWAHLARISYGIINLDEKQFLAYWIKKSGYPFLAISYPIKHKVFNNIYPEYSLNDFAKSSATIIKMILKKNKLKNRIISIHWSASGQIMHLLNSYLKKIKVELIFSLGLEASPALVIPKDKHKNIEIKNNLVSLKKARYPSFIDQIHQQNKINKTQIINKKIYLSDFVGDFSIALLGTNQRYINKKIKTNYEKSYLDRNAFDYKTYPFIANINGNSRKAIYHPFIDKTTWSFFILRKLYHEYLETLNAIKLTSTQFNNLRKYIDTIPNLLLNEIEGNHFLFLGKKGAKKIAQNISILEKKIEKIKLSIFKLIP